MCKMKLLISGNHFPCFWLVHFSRVEENIIIYFSMVAFYPFYDLATGCALCLQF